MKSSFVPADYPDVFFADLVLDRISKILPSTTGWTVDTGKTDSDFWIRVRSGKDLPVQGWKLHVSADSYTAERTLSEALPILLKTETSFKVVARRSLLADLNLGIGGADQVGKFITAYPADGRHAVRVASALSSTLSGQKGPVIVTDRPLSGSSVVYYRYGSFGTNFVRTPIGDVVPALRTPEGQLVPDQRTADQSPGWTTDPFSTDGLSNTGKEKSPLATTLICDRFLAIASIYRSPRGGVLIALDVDDLQRRILKYVRKSAVIGVPGREPADMLRYEYRTLEELRGAKIGPTPLGILEDNERWYLAMEDLGGETLSSYVGNRLSWCSSLRVEEVIRYGLDVIDLVSRLHENGFVFRDIKPNNIVVCSETGETRLIDFELASRVSGSEVFGRGSICFNSPEQRAGGSPTILDDVYSIGGVLHFLCSGTEPTFNEELNYIPDLDLLRTDNLWRIPNIIAKCLARKSQSRYQSVRDVGEALRNVSEDLPKNTVRYHSKFSGTPKTSNDLRSLALHTGKLLSSAGVRDDRLGRRWVQKGGTGNLSVASRDLGDGTSGAVIALSILYSKLGDCDMKEAALEGIQWLKSGNAFEESMLSGLFVGESGVALALLVVSKLLNEPQLQAEALDLAREISSLPLCSPDLYHGTAGRLLLYLRLWEDLGAVDQLEQAKRLGSALIDEAVIADDRSILWPIPSEYGGLASSSWLGLAHGVAGIGYALCRLYETTRSEQLLGTLLLIVDTLKRRAFRFESGEGGFAWPKADGESWPVAPLWCHGATGIGRFFLTADRVDIGRDCLSYAIGAAESIRTALWLGPTQCHGLAGSIDFLLDVYNRTGQLQFFQDTQRLVQMLTTYARDTTKGLQWLDRESVPYDHGLMSGYGGVGPCLLRADTPDSMVSLHDLLLSHQGGSSSAVL